MLLTQERKYSLGNLTFSSRLLYDCTNRLNELNSKRLNRENPIAGKAETYTPPDKGSVFQATRADDRMIERTSLRAQPSTAKSRTSTFRYTKESQDHGQFNKRARGDTFSCYLLDFLVRF